MDAGTYESELGPAVKRWSPPAPDVLVAVFGALVIALDGDGLHVRVVDLRAIKDR